jgi:membrane protein DedA with SNARE-associated domain
MLDLLNQLSVLLDNILTSIASNLWLSLGFIFLVCLGEAVFILGILVPSLPILVLTGGLIAAGKLPFWPIYFAAVAGAVAGDAISYYIGWSLKARIRTVWPFKNYLELIDRGETFFKTNGVMAIFIGRFITGIKAVIPGVAGVFGMPYRQFTFINIISSFVWAAVHILPGMLLTEWLKSMGLNLETVIIVGSLIFAVAVVLLHYWKRIILLFAPFMGEFGKSLQVRWAKKPKPVETTPPASTP